MGVNILPLLAVKVEILFADGFQLLVQFHLLCILLVLILHKLLGSIRALVLEARVYLLILLWIASTSRRW